MKGIYNDYIKYLWRCCKGLVNKRYREQVLKLRSPDSLILNHFGEDNDDAMFYYIDVDYPYSGWFVLIDRMIRLLVYADVYHLIPVINICESKLYSEPDESNQDCGLFDLFFIQPSLYKPEDIWQSRNVVLSDPGHVDIISGTRVFSQDDFRVVKMASAVRKYLKFNNETIEYINKTKVMMGGKKVLGVHARGTDYRAKYKNHPKFVDIDEYIEEVEKLDSMCEYDLIFVASDEERIIDAFKTRFPGKTIYNDAYRAKGDSTKGIHMTAGEAPRPLHRTKLAIEVMKDMLSLTFCSSIVGTLSNVVYMALVFKTARNEKYDTVKIIDHGYNSKGSDSVNTIKKQLKEHS